MCVIGRHLCTYIIFYILCTTHIIDTFHDIGMLHVDGCRWISNLEMIVICTDVGGIDNFIAIATRLLVFLR